MFDIDNYHKVFKKYPKCLMESDGRVYGFFFIGNYYKRKTEFYGAYPPSYLNRIRALFPNHSSGPALHVFGGSVEPEDGEIKIDINPSLKPTVCCNVQQLPFRDQTYKIIYSDPPYGSSEAKKYGFKLPNIRLVLRELRRVTQQGGILVWLDVRMPIFRKEDWSLIGTVGLFTGTNRAVRLISLFQAS